MKIKPLRIQNILRSGKTPEQVDAEYGIKVSRSDDGLVLFDYDDFRCDRHNRVVADCRGLILEEDSWAVVAYPFKRFFNYDECPSAIMDWDTAKAQEKLDGSLIALFNYKGKSRISTRGMIDALGSLPDPDPVRGKNLFADVVWPLLNSRKREIDPEFTYIFELVSPWNRIVTMYEEPRLVLLGIRHNPTCIEVAPDTVNAEAKIIGFDRPKQYQVQDVDQVRALIDRLRDTDEGFVICDEYCHRIKLKSERYLQFSKVINNGKPQYWRMILEGTGGKGLEIFPKYRAEYERLDDGFTQLLAWADETYEKHKDIRDRKEFASLVEGHPMSWYIWRRWLGLAGSAREVFRSMKPELQQNFLREKLPKLIERMKDEH